MAYNEALPFERGTTYFNGRTPVANEADHLLGKRFTVVDDTHQVGSPIELMVVKAEANITVARVGVEFDTDAGDIDRQVAEICNTAGAYGWPIDDKYVVASTITADDLFYVVTKGLCSCTTSATAGGAASDIAQGGYVTFDGAGKIDGSPSANNHIVGLADSTTTTTNTAIVILVGARRDSY